MLVAAMLFALPPCAFAAQPLDSTTVVSILVCDPGRDIYELEGHAALRIRNAETDYAVNWGLFDFEAPNFVYRFVKGETDYMAGAIPTPMFVDYYRAQGRKVTELVLDLTPEECARVVDAVNINLQPQNRTYRYNYVKDNCSTRPLAIIEKALADTLALAPAPATLTGQPATFRNTMRRHHANYPWYQFGIDLALGSGIDYPLNPREAAFAPTALLPMLEGATAGNRRLVSDINIMTPGESVIAPPTPWYLTPLCVFCVLFALCTLITLADLSRRKVTRWFDAVLFSAFGITGCILAFLVFVSSHEATSPNWLLLWLNPLCLLVPVCIWFRRASGFLICYQFVNFAAVIAAIILMPIMNQSFNWAFIPLAACDIMRSLSYIHITRCERKRKNLYRIRYSGSFSSR